MIKVTAQAEQLFLRLLLESDSLTRAVVHLYQNNHRPESGDLLHNFTLADYPGYAPAPLEKPVVGQAERPRATLVLWDPVSFDAPTTGKARLWGYLVVDPAGVVLFAEQFPAPVHMTAGGKPFALQPQMTLRSQL